MFAFYYIIILWFFALERYETQLLFFGQPLPYSIKSPALGFYELDTKQESIACLDWDS